MSSTLVTEVLVGPLRRDDRRTAVLARLEQIPRPLQVVLRGCYLEPGPVEDVAAACSLTLAELSLVRRDALAALARTRGSAPPVARREVPAAYR